MEQLKKIDLPAIKNIIIVASGKGGVGKSTVSANLSVALTRKGYKTALVDADIYGPSIPKMFGIEDAKIRAEIIEEKEIMFPIEKNGIKITSIGFLVDKSQGLIWRGPMASNVITHLFEKTKWGELDYMIIDFPPGTGDIQLTTIQKLNISGAIIVTTPQEISLNDVRKSISMFKNPDINVPIRGVIENMSWFTPVKHPKEKYFIFGSGGGEKLASEYNTKLLGQIPLITEVGEAGEKGISVFEQNNKEVTSIFEKIVKLMA